MLKIHTSDEKVVTTISGQYPVSDWGYTFTFNAGSKDYAAMLSHNLRDHLEKSLRTIREHAYNDGWKDAKAKRGKKTWFSGLL